MEGGENVGVEVAFSNCNELPFISLLKANTWMTWGWEGIQKHVHRRVSVVAEERAYHEYIALCPIEWTCLAPFE